MGFQFKLRRGTSGAWMAADPVLLEGEPGVETDTDRLKVGDGVRRWSELPYYLSEGRIGELVDDKIVTGPGEAPNLALLWQNAIA
jgi:hypothetical protein